MPALRLDIFCLFVLLFTNSCCKLQLKSSRFSLHSLKAFLVLVVKIMHIG